MIECAPFEPGDLHEIELQPQQAAEMAGFGDWRSLADVLVQAGPAWTARHAGRVVCCGGVGVVWAGRAEAWAFIAAGMPRNQWPALHRLARDLLDGAASKLGLRRIEASAAYGWPPGRRWLELLGFQEEGLARCYGPDGRDFWRFARIRA